MVGIRRPASVILDFRLDDCAGQTRRRRCAAFGRDAQTTDVQRKNIVAVSVTARGMTTFEFLHDHSGTSLCVSRPQPVLLAGTLLTMRSTWNEPTRTRGLDTRKK